MLLTGERRVSLLGQQVMATLPQFPRPPSPPLTYCCLPHALHPKPGQSQRQVRGEMRHLRDVLPLPPQHLPSPRQGTLPDSLPFPQSLCLNHHKKSVHQRSWDGNKMLFLHLSFFLHPSLHPSPLPSLSLSW